MLLGVGGGFGLVFLLVSVGVLFPEDCFVGLPVVGRQVAGSRELSDEYFSALFLNSEGFATRGSVRIGVAVLKLSWKIAYLGNCGKVPSKRELASWKRSCAALNKKQRSAFKWLCRGLRSLTVPLDVCADNQAVGSEQPSFAGVLNGFVRNALSLLQVEDPLSYRFMKGLVSLDKVLLLPTVDVLKDKNPEVSGLVKWLCDDGGPDTLFGKFGSWLSASVVALLDYKPPQLFPIFAQIGSIFVLRGHIKQCFKSNQHNKDVSEEDVVKALGKVLTPHITKLVEAPIVGGDVLPKVLVTHIKKPAEVPKVDGNPSQECAAKTVVGDLPVAVDVE